MVLVPLVDKANIESVCDVIPDKTVGDYKEFILRGITIFIYI